MMTTKPAGPEDNFPTEPPAYLCVTPLARAALANGVSFDDVDAYLEGSKRTRARGTLGK
jgi:hypothetical protein